jgi:PelA/Pel-15E family pectate lyase
MKVRGGLLFFLIAVLSVSLRAAIPENVNLTVAADGSGDLLSVQDAIDKVPTNNRERFVIKIKPGTYREQIRVPANKPYVSLIGESAVQTLLTFSISNKEAGSTSAAYAAYVAGHDFFAENLTFENSFGVGSQAVAMLAEADRVVFRRCRFLGWQDTLYAKNGRQYYENCYIEGHVDFVFGQAAAVLENCEIHSKGDGYIAAPMRFAADESSGLVFNKCRLTSNGNKEGVYLGRPWRDYGRTVYLNTEMGEHIRPVGWHHWLPERENTAYFAEYRSTGKGARTDARAKWSHQLTDAEAKAFSTEKFLKGKDGWNPGKANDKWLQKTPPDRKLVVWRDIFSQRELWYQTDEAARIADQLLIYQKVNGGFEKNVDMALMLTKKEKDELQAKRSDISETTIDNRTTYPQIAYLGKIISASLLKTSLPNNFPKYKEAFNKGLDYLFSAQYENGGFPQYFPLKTGYYTHITYNDDAMIGVLEFLRDVASKKMDYGFVDDSRRDKAKLAVAKGIDAILKTQVVVAGKKTVWCAQHDEVTLAPAWARAYEMPSLSGYESVGVVEFLMGMSEPDQKVIDAVESAVAWFNASKLTGIKIVEKANNSLSRKYDREVVRESNAAPLWARFYEIGTNKPIFSGRDSVITYSLSEIEAERRNGYRWYVSDPNRLLMVEYPAWKRRLGIK